MKNNYTFISQTLPAHTQCDRREHVLSLIVYEFLLPTTISLPGSCSNNGKFDKIRGINWWFPVSGKDDRSVLQTWLSSCRCSVARQVLCIVAVFHCAGCCCWYLAWMADAMSFSCHALAVETIANIFIILFIWSQMCTMIIAYEWGIVRPNSFIFISYSLQKLKSCIRFLVVHGLIVITIAPPSNRCSASTSGNEGGFIKKQTNSAIDFHKNFDSAKT